MATLSDIAELLQVPLRGDGGLRVTGIASLEEAGPTDLSFITSAAFLRELGTTRAAAVIAAKKLKLPDESGRIVFVVDNADLAVAKVLSLFAPPIPHPPAGIDAAARIASSVVIPPTAAIGPFVVIGE